MSTPKLTNKFAIGIKTETTQNTPVVPGATDYMLVEDLEIDPVGEQVQRNAKSSTLDRQPHVIGKKHYAVKFKTEVKGSGVAGVAYAPLAAALKAAGFTETINSGLEAIGAAVADGNNHGVSPAPVVEIGTPAFSAKSGTVRLTLISRTLTSPEAATFEAIFYPGDGSAALIGEAAVSDSAFTDVAFNGDLTSLTLTTNDPDAGGTGLPVSTWQVGDVWTFAYTSADEVNCRYTLADAAASSNFFGPGKSATIEGYKDGHKHIIGGCIGTVKFSAAKPGERVMADFEFQGLYADPTDAAFPTQTYSQVLPPKFESATVTIGGLASTHIISKFDIDPGWTITMRDDASAAYGVGGFCLTDRDPKGGCDPEAVPLTTDTIIKDFMDAAEAATTIVVGTTAGNIVTFSMPKTQYTGAPYEDKSGIVTHNLGLKFNSNAGASSIVITFS